MRKLSLFIGLFFCLIKLYACTDFLIPAGSNGWVNGRSLEFAQTFPTNVVIQGQGEVLQSIAPSGGPGLKWTSKYGYVGISCITNELVIDGMNEKGLTFGGLWLPGSQYQNVPQSSSNQALAIELLGKWILGNFASVEEVKAGLSQIYVWEGNPLPDVSIPPLHITIHDASGQSLVIEFLNGKQVLYNNTVKVLTNYPTFDWHVTNLENYVELEALNANPVLYNKTAISFKGQGSGMGGVPGDWSPPSRFVRIFYFKYFAKKPQSAQEGVNLAFHLLNTVDIPKGVVRERVSSSENTDFTQWVMVKDTENKTVYIRTYQNQNIYTINLNQLNLNSSTRYRPIPINSGRSYQQIQP